MNKLELAKLVIEKVTETPLNISVIAQQVNSHRDALYPLLRLMVQKNILQSKKGRNGGFFKTETLSENELLRRLSGNNTGMVYKNKNYSASDKRVAKCGHVSEQGRYYNCENCVPKLDDDDGDLIYFQSNNELEDNCE